ncbi:penicillin acylase family protein [Gottfriedia solisilvae]|uniref:penicillin acylase family protein n=1 Tax=Gottfriedia solisilvae TaxID=1516104 RepID=UPI003D2F1A50
MSTSIEVNQKRKRFPKWLKITSTIIIVLILLITGSGFYLTKKALPEIKGNLEVGLLEHNVSVTRDTKGVPHIEAKNLHDLYVAQGFVTAQDRLFQMDLSRRQASGQLSEIIGDATVDRDSYFRTLGLRRAAEASYSKYSKEAQNVLNWYAEGVNEYIKYATKEGKLPVEFKILQYKPTEWSAIDSLAIGKYMAFDLGGHWNEQAFRYYAMNKFPKEKALELFPADNDLDPYIIPSGTSKIDVEESFASAIIPPTWNGSNDWVVSGSKTKSGKPLLADDPHLGLATPAIWYETHLKSMDMNVKGVIFAGVPGIIVGHNDHVAWGVTNVGPDVQDLYIEKRNPNKPDEFLYDGKWEKATVVNETIKIKDKKSKVLPVMITRHGPVISEFASEAGKDTVFSLQWTALQPTRELEGVLKFNVAKDWDTFKEGLALFEAPAQNFVFASDDGTIAYRANGNIPIRKKGDGLMPVPGWTSDYDWKGFIPYEELPTLINPEEGFISTANNKVVDDSYPYHISHSWAQPYRQLRIREVLSQSDKLTVKDMQNLQMDEMNLQAKEHMPKFIQSITKQNKELTSIEKSALAELEKWNFVDDKDQPSPLIFQRWMTEINKALFDKQISKDMMDLFGDRKVIVDQLLRNSLSGKKVIWIDEKGGIDQLLLDTYQKTIKNISESDGDDVAKWSWGDHHKVAFTHPLSSIKVLSYFFNAKDPIPVGGSSTTVKAAGYDEDGIVDHGASWRTVVDFSDLSKSVNIVGPGQSGNIGSKWYSDQMEDWANGTYHTTVSKNVKGIKEILQAGK